MRPALSGVPYFWEQVWRRMEAEGTASVVFADGSVSSGREFAAEMAQPHVHPFLVYYGADLAGVFWLTNLEGRTGRGHFVVFRPYWALSRKLGLFVRDYLLAMRYDDESYCFDVLLGMVPESNYRAINLLRRCGMKKVGVIPFGAWLAAERKSVNMLVLCVTREAV